MHKPSSDFPTQSQLVFPLLDTVREMGGRPRARDVVHALSERLALDPAAASRTSTKPGNGAAFNLLRRHIDFARLKAVKLGYLTSGGRGTWQLPDEATTGLDRTTAGVILTVMPDADGLPVAAQLRLAVTIPRLNTIHTMVRGDARDLSFIGDGQVQLVVSSIPYHDLKQYEDAPGQIGSLPSYQGFVEEMERALQEMFRVLGAGGRACINVGDVLRSRAKHGHHHVLPLHADMLNAGIRSGFHAVQGIIWRKLGNCTYEEGQAGGVLGKPGQPNQVIKLEHEHILMLRKPGYRKTTEPQRRDSTLSTEESRLLFRDVWDDVPGQRTTPGGHPAPYPVEIPRRLIRAFSFSGDTVLDPFGGSLTTSVAALQEGRHSIAVEVGPRYLASGIQRVDIAARQLST